MYTKLLMRASFFFIASLTSLFVYASFAEYSFAKSTVKTTVNGVTKEFTAEDGESINYQSEDGSVKVNINNNGTNTPTSSSPTTTQTPTNTQQKKAIEKKVQGIKDEVDKKIAEQKKNVEEKKKELEKRFNLLDYFRDVFKDFFNFN